MIDDKTNKIIKELVDFLREKYSDFLGIYLFGSRARGDFNENSDYDFAIVFDRKMDSETKQFIRSKINKLMVEYDIIIDNPFINSNDLIEPVTPLRENIKKEGIFYAAAG